MSLTHAEAHIMHEHQCENQKRESRLVHVQAKPQLISHRDGQTQSIELTIPDLVTQSMALANGSTELDKVTPCDRPSKTL